MVASIKMNFLQKVIIPPPFCAMHGAACVAWGFTPWGDSVILSVLGRDALQAACACLSQQCAGGRGWPWSFGGKGAAHQPCPTLSQLMGQQAGTSQGVMQADAGKTFKDCNDHSISMEEMSMVSLFKGLVSQVLHTAKNITDKLVELVSLVWVTCSGFLNRYKKSLLKHHHQDC